MIIAAILAPATPAIVFIIVQLLVKFLAIFSTPVYNFAWRGGKKKQRERERERDGLNWDEGEESAPVEFSLIENVKSCSWECIAHFPHDKCLTDCQVHIHDFSFDSNNGGGMYVEL